MRIQMGGQVAIAKLSARNHAKIKKTLNFLVVRLSDFTVIKGPEVGNQARSGGHDG